MKPNHNRQLLLAGLLTSLVAGCAEDAPPRLAKEQDEPAIDFTVRTQGRYRERRFLREHDRFLAEDSPRIIAAKDAVFLEDDDEVLGFVIDGQPRAYSVRMLCYHHVVNDMVGDRPFAVTY